MPLASLRRLAPTALAPRVRRGVRAIAWILGGLLLLMALAWLGMPGLLRWQIEAQGSKHLGRAVTLQRVEFAPWTLRTTLHGLAVAKAPGAAGGGDQLHVDRIEFRTALASLWKGAPVIDALTIESPQLSITHRGDGHYDIDDILQRLAEEPSDPASPPPRFALRHFQLTGGAVEFDDRGKKHSLRELVLNLPEISSLARDRDRPVLPRLAFVLDGSRFDSTAQATPFADLRKGEVALRFHGLDLAPYLEYLPAGAPVRVSAAVLDADVKITFAQPPEPAPPVLDLSGTLTAHGLALSAPVAGVGDATFSAEQLKLAIAHLRPFTQEVAIDRIDLTRPHTALRRVAAGQPARQGKRGDRLEVEIADASPSTVPASPAPPSAPGAAAKNAPASTAAPAWKLSLGQVAVREGTLDWADTTGGLPVALGLRALSLDAGPLAWPLAAAVPFDASAELTGPAAASAATAKLALRGSASLQGGQVDVSASALPLAWAGPYLKGTLRPSLEGLLGAEATVAWSPGGVSAEAKTLQLDRLALRQGAATLLGVRQLQLAGVRVDTARRHVQVQRLALADPRGTVSRDTKGRWMFEDWMVAAPAAAPRPAETPWAIALGTVEGQGGAFAFRDASRQRPVAVDLSALRFSVTDMAWPPATARGKPPSVDLSLQMASGQASAGSLRYRGSVALAPLGMQGQVNAKRLPLAAFEPYFGDALNVLVSRADVGFDGKVKLSLPPAGMQLQVDGDVAVEDGRVDNATPDTPAASPAGSVSPAVAAAGPSRGALTAGARRASSLLSWKTLGLRGVSLAMAPGQPVHASVRETTLGDFFARIAIDETGRINLRDLVKQAPGEAVAAAAAAPAAPAAATPVLRFGPTRIVNGRVEFADRFIKPSYTASLSELNGSLGTFASVAEAGQVQMADLELRGKAEGTASLDVTGKLNPLAKPLALDIVGKVRDLDLPALSPYAVKYSGHGIERGKLSMDVAYQVQPDGQLTARNSLVLHQLVFGEPVAGAPASLPVQLAVALLADRNGVIDLDLPISGSLNDPQFSLGPVIVKALLNLLVKAVTAPFSLLAHAFGGDDAAAQAAAVDFAPGSATLSPEAQKRLGQVAKVLADKPSIDVTVTGTASLAAETEGYRRERLMQLARAEKRRAVLAAAPATATATATASGGAAPAASAASEVVVAPGEYPALLKQVYARTDMPKPRNMIGLAKDLPVDEMEKLLAAQIDVGPDTIQALAVRRGGVVRDYLAAQGAPADRLFLGAARQVEATGAWKPQAELKLSAR
ncbi:MAG: DUF748 domain-containing protein [Pseudomonadota bacterium]